MAARALLIFLLLFGITNISAQPSKIDSLKSIFNKSKKIEDKFASLKQLISEIEKTNVEAAIPYLEELLNLSLHAKDSNLIADAYNQIGVNAYRTNRFTVSTSLYFKALNATPKDNMLLKARLNNNIGWNFQKQDEAKKAAPYFKVAEKLFRQLGDSATLAYTLNNIGVLHKNLGNYNKALAYHHESLAIHKKLLLHSQLPKNYNNLGVVYFKLGQQEKALKLFERALKTNYVLKDTLEIILNLINAGSALNALKQHETAIDTLKKSLSMIQGSNYLDENIEINQELHNSYVHLNDFENALKYFKKSTVLSDSLYKNGQIEAMSELESKYKIADQEKEIQSSRSELLQQRLNRSYIITGFIIAIIIIYLLARLAWIKRKSERKLMVLNQAVQEQSDEILNNNLSLETKIEERTSLIKDQKERIRKYAFTNSHNLRGPLSRIMGLIGLILPERDLKTRDEMVLLIKKSAKEMDEVITNVSRHLEDDDI